MQSRRDSNDRSTSSMFCHGAQRSAGARMSVLSARLILGSQFCVVAAVVVLSLQMSPALAWMSPPAASMMQPRTGRHLSASTTVKGNVNANNNKANNAGSAYGLSSAFFSKESVGARGSGFRGGVLAVATEDGMERGEGVRGLEAAVRFFPRLKRQRELEEQGPPVYRSVRNAMKLPRLPAWPVQNGIILAILDALRLTKLAFHLEDLWGGRVGVLIPGNTLETDPFVLLAHHRHTFWPLDPIRQLSNVIQPEGFPAHPHRGFQTVTYIMRGGMTHRDSMGLKQEYSAGQVQWMNAGRGILHEEMWHTEPWEKTDVEIYQIWVDLPSSLKMSRPRIQLAGKGADLPLPIVQPSEGTEVVVIAGELCGEVSPIETVQRLSMLHVQMKPEAKRWAHKVPWGHQCLIYVRRGELTVIPTEEGYFEGEEDREPQVVSTGNAVLLAPDGDYARFENRGKEDLDFMLIESEPTGEPTAIRKSLVMNSDKELDEAAKDIFNGYFGRPWDHRLKDDEWREAIQGATGKRTSYKSDEG